ncbi:MAG: hypothetical protein P9L94_06275 [Candidatus Hinthialibacter antarcticus]|nr:hypothetical protein [Candidatus Hinthialibacter antarcticus]
MNSKIEYALIWKEVRQSGPIVAAFCLMSLIIVAYLSWLHNYSPQRLTHYTLSSISEWLHYYIFFISLGLAYLMAAGNRILEANDNLEAFLFIRPIERFTLLRVYYFVGLAGVALWFIVFFMFVYLFFGSEIFTVFINRNYDAFNTNFGLLVCLVAMFIGHGVSFSVSMISPSLITTSVGYVLSLATVIAVFILSMQQRTETFPVYLTAFFLRFMLPLASVGILAAFLGLTIVYYQKKQVR